MAANVVRKRTDAGNLPSDGLPPVLLRLPVLADSKDAQSAALAATEPAAEDAGGQPPGEPETAEGPSDGAAAAAIHRTTRPPLWTLDHPVWQHWGTKAGLVAGACLLLLSLYQFVGKQDGDGSSADKSGKVAKQADDVKPGPEAKNAGPNATRPKPKPVRKAVAKGGTAKLPGKGPGKQPAPRPQPVKGPGKLAGPAKNPAPAGPPAVADAGQGPDNRQASSPPDRAAVDTGPQFAGPSGPTPEFGTSGPAPRPPRTTGPQQPTRPMDPPNIAGNRVPGSPGQPLATDRTSGFGAGGPAGVPAAQDPARGVSPGPDTRYTVTRPTDPYAYPGDPSRQVSYPTTDHPQMDYQPANQPALAGGGGFPTTGTPRETYAWPQREPSPVVHSQVGTGDDGLRTSGYGDAPPSMHPRYPTTAYPDDQYLRRQTASDAPAYRTSMREAAPASSYDGTYQSSPQPGTARLYGTIESTPIRSNYEQP